MSDIKPTKLAFEDRYGDDSGVQYGVTFDAGNLGNEIAFESVDKVRFPVERLDWLIERLSYIRERAVIAPKDQDR
jgi:hypothetical protein